MPSTLRYACPGCGAGLEFDSKLQKMKCPYCDSIFSVSDFVADTATAAPKPKSDAASGLGCYRCSGCGAEVIADEVTAATNCPYCSNPIILTGNLEGQLMPDYIIPFKISREEAKAALKKHLSGKKLLPKVFTSEHHLDEIKGIYVPFWLFDTTADSTASYTMTRTRTWSDSEYNYTETSRYRADRAGTIRFENIPADGSKKMADDMMESLETFDFDAAVPFDPVYFSGYFADRYDISADKCVSRIENRVRKSAMDALEDTVTGYGSITQESGNVRLVGTRKKYAMYPVWILNTTWRGKTYMFAMNGESGKFVGDLPVDKMIYWKWRLLYGLGFAGILYGAMYFLGIL